MDIIDKLDNIIEAKKKKKQQKVSNPDHAAMKQKKATRVPSAPPTQFHKDKSKYKRNPKHKKSFLD
jgi:hypothetical protein